MTQTARQRQGAESRLRILDAAEALISEQGFAATSISQIARDSGLPASSIYWHFVSKEDLLSAVVERGALRWHRALPAWSHFDVDLAAFLEAIGKGVDERPAFLRLFMMLTLEGRDTSPESARELVEQVWHRVRLALAGVFTEAFDLGTGPAADRGAERLARFALAHIDGVFVDAHVDPDGTDVPAQFADLLVALEALAGAGAGPADEAQER
jgi:AcrR family transcriptional regulator